jgi:hypothetical protein
MSGDPPSGYERLDQVMGQIARESAAQLHVYPRAGHPVRRVVLQDSRDERGTMFTSAQLETDGTLRITGADTGSRVSEFFGDAITSYDWVYVVASDRVGALCSALGGHAGDDVLSILAAYYEQGHGRLHEVLTGPQVAASFSNWHS